MEQSTPKGIARTPGHENVPDHQKLTVQPAKPPVAPRPKETGRPKGPEPTRYGDWESKGRCVDF